ncbi:MAG TPA: deoxyguanosinetriphosphate triphosphohydrolase, partial [Burkholderiales bacterium]|nr:deoxyguanosinetriphosphate triphosphohydrolase [Burkholderiales bacterium]
VQGQFPSLAERRAIYETIRRMINTLVNDLIGRSRENITETSPQSVDAVRAAPALIDFSPPILREQQELKSFLMHNLYRHYRVNRAAAKARRIVRELFAAFLEESRLLPPDFQEQFQRDGVRAIADYVAGMTDRYAIREHRRLFAVEEG